MADQCLFCPRPVDSAEHIWSDWILKDLKPAQPIHIRIARSTNKWVDNPEVRIKAVCQKCNNDWMNDLETANEPHIRASIHDKSIVLGPAQQKLLTRWAILKAMVLDGSSKRRIPFYSQRERSGIKPPSSCVPVGSSAWIGRLSDKAFHAGLTDTFGDINNVPKAFHGCITTLIVGHLAVQVLTMHVLPMFAVYPSLPNCRPGPWDLNLLNIWPVFGNANWPPLLTFTLKGADSIGALVNRWKVGTDIT
jgi:hypothetical protein